jgi:hypothetical protein
VDTTEAVTEVAAAVDTTEAAVVVGEAAAVQDMTNRGAEGEPLAHCAPNGRGEMCMMMVYLHLRPVEAELSSGLLRNFNGPLVLYCRAYSCPA